MKEKIIAYLSGPRPYREGIALYEEYGLNLMLKATFRRNTETDLLRATLMEELRKLAGISETAFRTMQRKAVDSPHISSASIVVGEIKAEETAVNVPVTPVVENVIRFRDRFPFLNSPDCPDVLKILVADMFTAYDLYLKTFRELEGLLEINKIINGFTSESFSLHKGESKRIKANGILVICSQYYNLYPSIAVISPATKNIEYIGGYKEYIDGTLFTFTFENDYTTIMTSKIEGVEGSRVPFLIAYQNLLP